MGLIDLLTIIVYFAVVLSVGIYCKKLASKNLESYFLGGKSMNWFALSISGAISTYDISGTMWIVSILFVLGMKSMWHHWMWGLFMGAFFMTYMGKWVRRSNVMTAAEWMRTRFGDDAGGRLARTTYALMAVLTLAGAIGYAAQGVGKFASVYIPLENLAKYTSVPAIENLVTQHEAAVLAVTIIGIVTLYVLLGGLYSVVLANVLQAIVLTIASIIVAYIAWSHLTLDKLAKLPADWTSLRFPWRMDQFAGTDNALFQFFGAMVIVWVLKGFLLNAGGPAQMYDFQLFLASKNARDAAKLGAAWSFFLIVRWALAAGITLLGLVEIVGVTDSEKVMPIVPSNTCLWDSRVLCLPDYSPLLCVPSARRSTPVPVLLFGTSGSRIFALTPATKEPYGQVISRPFCLCWSALRLAPPQAPSRKSGTG